MDLESAWPVPPGGGGQAKASRYRFGTESAEFQVCATCGAVPSVTCVMDGARYAVVNVNAFDDVASSERARAEADFEDEAMETRLARRRRNWTPEAVS